MNRSGLYVVIGLLVAVLMGLGIYLYNEQTKPGLDLRVDEGGISIKGNG